MDVLNVIIGKSIVLEQRDVIGGQIK